MAQHQPSDHFSSHVFGLVSIAHTVEVGAPFITDHDLQMDIVAPTGKLRDAPIPGYRFKDLSIGGTFTDPQAITHLRDGSADVD